MSARKFVQSAYLDSSAFIPLIDASNSLHNKIVNHLKETQLFPPKFTRASDLPDVLVQTEMAGLETSQSMISQERNEPKVD